LLKKNPALQLEELRRSSLIEVENLVLPSSRRKSNNAETTVPDKASVKFAATPRPAILEQHSSSENMSEFELATEEEENAVVKRLEQAAEIVQIPVSKSSAAVSSAPAVKMVTTFSEPDYMSGKDGSKNTIKDHESREELSPTRH
jgi:hypothetical protein